MMRLSGALAGVAGTILLIGCAAHVPAGKASQDSPRTYRGILAYYDDFSGTVIVEGESRKQKEFVLADTARIIQADRTVTLQELDTKRSLLVYFANRKGRAVALRIQQ